MKTGHCVVCGKLLTWAQMAYKVECCSYGCCRALEARRKLDEAVSRRKQRMADLGLPDGDSSRKVSGT